MTLKIPHPYPTGCTVDYLRAVTNCPPENGGLNLAITLRLGGEVTGCITLDVCDDLLRGEVGYWVGPLFWGHGICTEALREVVDYGFRELDLERIFGGHFVENSASGRVQEKVGMRKEGVLRSGAIRFGQPKDLVMRAITRSDWKAHQSWKNENLCVCDT